MAADIFGITVTSAGLTTATTAYTAGDQAGTEMTFANAAQLSGGGGIIVSATLFDLSNKINAGDFELWLFTSASTPAADNAAASWTDANMALKVAGGPIIFRQSDWKIMTNNSTNTQDNLMIAYDLAATSLFGNFVTRQANAVYSAVGDLKIRIGCLRA